MANAINVVANGSSGATSLGGNGDYSSTFSGPVTLNANLTVSQVATTGGNALSLTGGIAGGSGANTVTFAGPGKIAVSTTGISNGGGTTAVNISGGTTVFSATNTYSGATTVGAGMLELIAGGLGSTAISVSPGATFGVQPGSATAITGGSSLTLNGGDSSAAAFTMIDNAISTFNTGGLTTTSGTVLPTLSLEIGNSLGSIDLLNMGSAAASIAAGTHLSFAHLTGSLAPGDYTFMTAGSGLGPGAFTLDTSSFTVGGITYPLSLADSTGTAEILTVIPEPGTLVLLAAGLIALLAYAWRKRK